jgi:hypothetical protein
MVDRCVPLPLPLPLPRARAARDDVVAAGRGMVVAGCVAGRLGRALAVRVGVGLGLVACEPPPAVTPPPVPPTPGFVVARPDPTIRSLNDVVVLGAAETGVARAVAVGTDGAVLAFDGATWTRETSGTAADLESVSGFVDGTGIETVLAVGASGTVLARSSTDGVWRALPSPVTAHLFGVWLASGTDAFIVGDDGTVLRWDGTTLVQLVDEVLIDSGAADGSRFPIADPLKSVMGRAVDDVYAVGPRGGVWRFDGTAFRREDTETNRPLVDVFTRAGVWVAATDGVLLRRRDDGWRDDEFVVPAPVFVQGIWARGDGDVFVVGLADQLFHLENGVWTIVELENGTELRAVDGTELPRAAEAPPESPTLREVVAVGGGGRIVRGPLVLPLPGEQPLTTRPAVEVP